MNVTTSFGLIMLFLGPLATVPVGSTLPPYDCGYVSAVDCGARRTCFPAFH